MHGIATLLEAVAPSRPRHERNLYGWVRFLAYRVDGDMTLMRDLSSGQARVIST